MEATALMKSLRNSASGLSGSLHAFQAIDDVEKDTENRKSLLVSVKLDHRRGRWFPLHRGLDGAPTVIDSSGKA